MPDDVATLPSTDSSSALSLIGRNASPALQIMLDPNLFEKAKLIAKYMADARGFTPRHLLGCPEACFAVVVRSMTWKLDPFSVAASTYQLPGSGQVGYEGKLCQAILENSGQLTGGVKFEHYGPWDNVQGKWERKRSQKGNEYASPTWTDKDAIGCGVIVSAQIMGEAEPRTLRFDLTQAFPRNSTLWATDPKTQICYTAVRRFASVAAPGVFMGVPFDRDEAMSYHVGPDHAKDITPPARPTRTDYVDAEPEPMFSYEALDGSSITSGDPEDFAEAAVGLLQKCDSTLSVDELRDRISVNFDALRDAERVDLVDYIEGEFGKVWDGLRADSAAKAAAEAEEKFPGDDEDDEAPGEPSALELACSVDEKVKAATPDTIEGLSNEVEIAAKALTNDGLADQAKNLKSRYEARRMNLTGEPDGRLV
jgi:hypothetical protein